MTGDPRLPADDAAGPPAVSAAAVTIRPIRLDDASRLQEFHLRLSDDTIRKRFFGPHPVLPDAEARRFTSLPPGAEAALVATVQDRIIGVGRYISFTDGESAEIAFVVEDAHQGRGIGTGLLTGLARLAWPAGIRRFVADTFATNRAMLDVFMHTTAAVTVLHTRRDGPVVHVVMAVVPPDSA